MEFVDDTLVQASQLRSDAASGRKSAFLALMSHELRTPLFGILGRLDLALEDRDWVSRESAVPSARDCAGHLLRLLNDLLDLLKIESDQLQLAPEPTDIDDLVQDVTDGLLEFGRQEGVELIVTREAHRRARKRSRGSLDVDPMRLRQVLSNLVTNAVKFSSEGAVVEVRIDRQPARESFGHDRVRLHVLRRPEPAAHARRLRAHGRADAPHGRLPLEASARAGLVRGDGAIGPTAPSTQGPADGRLTRRPLPDLAIQGRGGEARSMAIVHELSWSTSRTRTFDTCRRRYYHDYYLSWLGWSRGADPDRRRAYLLKKMTRLPMLAGDIVHRAIAEWFARRDQGLAWSREEATAWAVTELRRGYKESRDGGWKARPAKSVRLAEHHYSEPRIDEADGSAAVYGKRYVERIEACIASFFEDPALADLRASEPADWLACEEMSTFELFDTKIFAIPDFAYLDRVRGEGSNEPHVRIVDWKTGAPSDADRFQLEVYAFYARERWKVDPQATTAVDVYLQDRTTSEVRVTEADLDRTLADIEQALARMKAVHFDADRSVGDPEAFPMVDEGAAAHVCGSCNYRELCGRG